MFQIKSSILSLISIFLVSACGFQPVYKHDTANSKSCKNFSVETQGYQEYGVHLKYRLQDKLNRACINPEQNYVVNVVIDRSRESVSIQKNREVSRYNTTFSTNYSVTNITTGKSWRGANNLIGGYDAVASDYGTYSQGEDTTKKLAIESADTIALKVLMKLRNN